MTRTNRPLFRFGRKSRRDQTGPRQVVTPGPVEGLERRGLLSIVGLTANASPMILRQINPMNQPHAVQVARIRPVTLAGYVAEDSNVVPTVSFRVVDEYGRDQPSGVLPPQPAKPGVFFFSTRIGLDRTHRPGDRDGRQYTVFVTAQDPQGTRTIAIAVTTPHVRHGRKPS
jgi:hypothetical protein